MKSLPQTDDSLLIRTDYSDQSAWEALHTAITTPNRDGFLANVHIVDDPDYSDLTTEQVLALALASGNSGSLLIVADTTSLFAPEMPLLAVPPSDEDDEDDEDYEDDEDAEQEHGELRVTAAELWSIENNIDLGNMDWEDFVNAAGDDGVFRGFR
ncbi:hypothetical protein [Streptomyces sp. HB132]|uniref:DUF6924 domain-containing protein n=1 Tax=Streptomyces sp. HB132 TaxID=767388 RepID=UPI001960DE62|nr:hypothetical protein [Streptomyces sp. HB132]MBM7436794.1 nucleotide-binding universal stress UspA family protein [Streptomyces sp. HB132]